MKWLVLLGLFITCIFGGDLQGKQALLDAEYKKCLQSNNEAVCIISVTGKSVTIEGDTNEAVYFLDRNYEDIRSYEDYQMAEYFNVVNHKLTDDFGDEIEALKECSSAAIVYAIYYETRFTPEIKRAEEEYSDWGISVCTTSVQTFILGLKD